MSTKKSKSSMSSLTEGFSAYQSLRSVVWGYYTNSLTEQAIRSELILSIAKSVSEERADKKTSREVFKEVEDSQGLEAIKSLANKRFQDFSFDDLEIQSDIFIREYFDAAESTFTLNIPEKKRVSGNLNRKQVERGIEHYRSIYLHVTKYFSASMGRRIIQSGVVEDKLNIFLNSEQPPTELKDWLKKWERVFITSEDGGYQNDKEAEEELGIYNVMDAFKEITADVAKDANLQILDGLRKLMAAKL